jgi:hypothetical protein
VPPTYVASLVRDFAGPQSIQGQADGCNGDVPGSCIGTTFSVHPQPTRYALPHVCSTQPICGLHQPMSTVRFSFSMTSAPKNERLPLPRATSLEWAHAKEKASATHNAWRRTPVVCHVLAYLHVHLRRQLAFEIVCSTEELWTRLNSLPHPLPCYEHEYDMAVLTSDLPGRRARFWATFNILSRS